ncbi:cytochrome P450 [Armillaria mellea]|nr:cytochrome P450 [Armillaria mellea]
MYLRIYGHHWKKYIFLTGQVVFKCFLIDTQTVSTVLSTMLAFLLYPEVQAKAQAELDAVVGHARLPNFDDRAQLPYINAVVLEALRWNPVVPMGVPHRSVTEDVYRGYYIPAGATVLGNVCLRTRLHLHPLAVLEVLAKFPVDSLILLTLHGVFNGGMVTAYYYFVPLSNVSRTLPLLPVSEP